jgi:S-adenosylmethionine/arginine decarboxylase-like enzyme
VNATYMTDGEIRQEYAKRAPWGLYCSVDLKNCSPDAVRNEIGIKNFVKELCDRIEMKRFGETQVVHFGEDEKVAGFSMVQLIETSLISGHFANLTNSIYLDVFSCKAYSPRIIAEFAKDYFKADSFELEVNFRD